LKRIDVFPWGKCDYGKSYNTKCDFLVITSFIPKSRICGFNYSIDDYVSINNYKHTYSSIIFVMDMPCTILRGCVRGEKAIDFVKKNLGERFSDSQRTIELTGVRGKPIRAFRWSWGVEIGCHGYRHNSTLWWEELLNMFCSVSDFPEIVLLYNVDSLGLDNQRVIRRHVEDDYKHARYVLTCSRDSMLDPSLESRCAIMIMDDDPIPKLPMIKTKKDAEELWLSDVHAKDILDNMFQREIDVIKDPKLRSKCIRLWCWYSDVLKYCYQELTILECAFQELKRIVPKHKR